jgi:hypothetical protein
VARTVSTIHGVITTVSTIHGYSTIACALASPPSTIGRQGETVRAAGRRAGARITRVSTKIVAKVPNTDRAILHARPRIVQIAWSTGNRNLLRHDAAGLDRSTHQAVMDTGLIQ